MSVWLLLLSFLLGLVLTWLYCVRTERVPVPGHRGPVTSSPHQDLDYDDGVDGVSGPAGGGGVQ